MLRNPTAIYLVQDLTSSPKPSKTPTSRRLFVVQCCPILQGAVTRDRSSTRKAPGQRTSPQTSLLTPLAAPSRRRQTRPAPIRGENGEPAGDQQASLKVRTTGLTVALCHFKPQSLPAACLSPRRSSIIPFVGRRSITCHPAGLSLKSIPFLLAAVRHCDHFCRPLLAAVLPEHSSSIEPPNLRHPQSVSRILASHSCHLRHQPPPGRAGNTCLPNADPDTHLTAPCAFANSSSHDSSSNGRPAGPG